MNIPVDIILGNGLNDPLGALDVHIREGVVPNPVSRWPSAHAPTPDSLGGIVAADQVVDNVRVPDALLDRLGVVQVVFLAPI